MFDLNRQFLEPEALYPGPKFRREGFCSREFSEADLGCDLPSRRRADEYFRLEGRKNGPRVPGKVRVVDGAPDQGVRIDEDAHTVIPIRPVPRAAGARRKRGRV